MYNTLIKETKKKNISFLYPLFSLTLGSAQEAEGEENREFSLCVCAAPQEKKKSEGLVCVPISWGF